MSPGFVVIGLFAGILSGLVGVGGGVVIVPALVMLYGFTQHTAQGTTLGVLILPVGFLAAYTYYQKGYVNVGAALLICLGFVLGGLIGAKIATSISSVALKRVFGVVMVAMGIRMLLSR